MNNKPFEIPEAMRELSERNVKQAQNAYQQFIETVHNAQATAEKSSGAVTGGTHNIQSLIMKFTEQNISASFSFASRLTNASNIQEAMQIQQTFAQEQIKNYTNQTQEIVKEVTVAGKKVKPKA